MAVRGVDEFVHHHVVHGAALALADKRTGAGFLRAGHGLLHSADVAYGARHDPPPAPAPASFQSAAQKSDALLLIWSTNLVFTLLRDLLR